MSDLAVSSFHAAPILARHPVAVALAAATPWRRILAVEPDLAALRAGALLLAKASYCVTPAANTEELFRLRGLQGIALAILSDRLGERLLGRVAATIRRQWPRARILILGKAALSLEDHLYDEQISHSSDPQQVLADLERLYQGMWNERSNSLDWDATLSAKSFARSPIAESDPTKILPKAPTQDKRPYDTPADLRIPLTRDSQRPESKVL